MNKKLSLLFLLFTFLFITSCEVVDYNKKKPNNFFYTKDLYNKVTSSENVKVLLFETNLHKEIDVTTEGVDTVKNFIENLKNESFISKPEDLSEEAPYKFFVDIDEDRYVINVYDDASVSLHPWDGVYSPDYINTSKVYKAYNLHKFSKYILKK
ncbi:DUF4883 family protein [Clostridium hydrogeniformans]|uniref:DUF4883 family protein n=1 Tax=Clostridium hydrogeniformans TaxID=349933 RepID=UPI0004841CA8|nr:DUF4883 family protein [Clostridium hydrogeniformans]